MLALRAFLALALDIDVVGEVAALMQIVPVRAVRVGVRVRVSLQIVPVRAVVPVLATVRVRGRGRGRGRGKVGAVLSKNRSSGKG